ncbi:MAG: lytic murein transglycosylase [Desulfuromonadaceae bacterium]
MRLPSRLVLLMIGVCALLVTGSPLLAASGEFAAWLDELRREALAAGISEPTLDAALAEIREPLPRVLDLDHKQPEFTQTLSEYVASRVSGQRIARGRTMLKRYPTWLGRVERRYRVQKRFLLALWGIETNYGEHSGSFPVMQSLVTLAHDGRRSGYFRKELFDALFILDAGYIPLSQLKGSWAGAMGQCQFMPSSFRHYAVDAEGDGRIDIWHSVPDVLASTANYLKQLGWDPDRTWGRPVTVPADFDAALAGLQIRFPLARWQALGVRRIGGKNLPQQKLEASLLLPEGPSGPAYLVYDNFRVLLAWNRSEAFAVAVGTLADRIVAGK